MDTIRALIVDDEPLAREGLRLHLSEHPDIEVIGECGDGATACVQCAHVAPSHAMPARDTSSLPSVAVHCLPCKLHCTALSNSARMQGYCTHRLTPLDSAVVLTLHVRTRRTADRSEER